MRKGAESEYQPVTIQSIDQRATEALNSNLTRFFQSRPAAQGDERDRKLPYHRLPSPNPGSNPWRMGGPQTAAAQPGWTKVATKPRATPIEQTQTERDHDQPEPVCMTMRETPRIRDARQKRSQGGVCPALIGQRSSLPSSIRVRTNQNPLQLWDGEF